jgi:hypothetical protein
MVGQPFFNFDLDSVNPLGSVILSLCYIFYDTRLSKLEKSANFNFISKTLIKLAEKAYILFRRPLSYYLKYLKIAEE